MNEAESVMYKAKLLRYKKQLAVTSEGMWWIDQQLEEMEQEKQEGRPLRRPSLRHWLKHLLLSIIQQNGRSVKSVGRSQKIGGENIESI